MRTRRLACGLPTLALALALALGAPALIPSALAQDAPPHEGEGLRPAKKAKAAAPAQKPDQKGVHKNVPSNSQPSAPSAASGQKPPAGKASPAPGPAQKKATKASRGPGVKNDGKPYLRSLDKNHDGRINREEFLADSKKRFAKADTNRDGVVSPQEAKAAKALLLEKKVKSDAKRLAEGKPVKRGKKSAKPPAPYLSTFDKNKDGRVTQKEYLARRDKKFAEMDLNHDGVISREEGRIAKVKLLERREARKAEAKALRLRKIEENRLKTQQAAAHAGASSSGPELTAPASPPPAPRPAAPAGPQQPSPAPAQPEPLTPLTPGLPAQGTPET